MIDFIVDVVDFNIVDDENFMLFIRCILEEMCLLGYINVFLVFFIICWVCF